MRRISKRQTKTYFNIINLFILASFSLFYCLYFHIHFKSLRTERERERETRVLVYIFVRETQIFIDKQGSLLVLCYMELKMLKNWTGVNTKRIYCPWGVLNTIVFHTARFRASVLVQINPVKPSVNRKWDVWCWKSPSRENLIWITMVDNTLAQYCAIISQRVVHPSTLYIFIAGSPLQWPFRVQFKAL